jgi:hypothetical protein
MLISLGKMVFDVGLAVAKACEPFARGPLVKMIDESQANKARLLHYYPLQEAVEDIDSLCGTHVDHSLLTGLCEWKGNELMGGAALYLKEGETVSAPDANAGLYIYPRGQNDPVKITIPPDCLGWCCMMALT